MVGTDVSGDSCFSLQVRALERSDLKCLHTSISALGLECAMNTTSLCLWDQMCERRDFVMLSPPL